MNSVAAWATERATGRVVGRADVSVAGDKKRERPRRTRGGEADRARRKTWTPKCSAVQLRCRAVVGGPGRCGGGSRRGKRQRG